MHWAVTYENQEIVNFLLKYDAKINDSTNSESISNKRDSDGDTAFEYILREEETEGIEAAKMIIYNLSF